MLNQNNGNHVVTCSETVPPLAVHVIVGSSGTPWLIEVTLITQGQTRVKGHIAIGEGENTTGSRCVPVRISQSQSYVSIMCWNGPTGNP